MTDATAAAGEAAPKKPKKPTDTKTRLVQSYKHQRDQLEIANAALQARIEELELAIEAAAGEVTNG